MPRARLALAVVVGGCALGAVVSPARADDAPIDELLALITKRPAGMSEGEWKEARRDAARELGNRGDRRAVPVLIDVVKAEEFDVVAEIAIEALGKLGDDRAVPVLQSVVADPQRDDYARQAARTALRRIGATPSGDATRAGDVGVATPTAAGAWRSAPAPARGPDIAPDVIAAYERITFAAGAASLGYDTLTETASLDGDVRARYQHGIETDAHGYSYGGRASAVAGVVDLPGDDSIARALSTDLAVDGEARLYLLQRPLFGFVAGALGATLSGLRADQPGADAATSLRFGLDVNLGLGLGYGRVIDFGEVLRVRRLERVLADARALGRPIQDNLAHTLMRAWWALRGEQGAQRRLATTVALLREAGVLLGEPDAALTYELLQVLVDGQLVDRPEGYEARVGIGESYLVRDGELGVEDGRVETAFAEARLGRQAPDGASELVGRAVATARLFADDDAPSPWLIDGSIAWRSYVYGDAWDALGALELAGAAGASNDGVDGVSELGSRLEGAIGWLWSPTRATRYRVAGHVRLDTGELFAGVSFDANYGFLDASFVGGALPVTATAAR